MRAGELRHRLSILIPYRSADGSGGYVQEWACCGETWAAIEPQSGGELLKADQLQAIRRYIVRTRYRTDINATMRFSWGGLILEVKAVLDPGGRHERLEIVCDEVPNAG